MNPILDLMKNQKQNNNNKQSSEIQSMINDLSSGKIDAKKQSLDIVKNMSPQQRVALRQVLPQLKKLAKVFGVSDENLQKFINELNSNL